MWLGYLSMFSAGSEKHCKKWALSPTEKLLAQACRQARVARSGELNIRNAQVMMSGPGWSMVACQNDRLLS